MFLLSNISADFGKAFFFFQEKSNAVFNII